MTLDLDGDGYPTEESLDAIREWDTDQFADLMDEIERIWWGGGYERRDDRNGSRAYYLHTVGWSGNESIIEALEDHHVFWMIAYEAHYRGGHYVFVLHHGYFMTRGGS